MVAPRRDIKTGVEGSATSSGKGTADEDKQVGVEEGDTMRTTYMSTARRMRTWMRL